MIDLLMLLLLLFSGQQVATTMKHQNISVSEGQPLPLEIPGDDALANRLRRLSIDLLSDGNLLFDGKEISLPDLIEKARTERVAKVYLQIDNDASYIQIRKVIGELSDKGLSIELG